MNKYLLEKSLERTTGALSQRVCELNIYLGTGNIHAWVSRGTESVAEANTATEPLRTMLPTRGDARAARRVGEVLGSRLNHLKVQTVHYSGSIGEHIAAILPWFLTGSASRRHAEPWRSPTARPSVSATLIAATTPARNELPRHRGEQP